MLYYKLWGGFFEQFIAVTNVCELTEHLARHLNRNTQYGGLDEPLVGKEYHAALITDPRWFTYNIPIDKLIRFALLKRQNLSGC
jgi:hypothetical protein